MLSIMMILITLVIMIMLIAIVIMLTIIVVMLIVIIIVLVITIVNILILDAPEQAPSSKLYAEMEGEQIGVELKSVGTLFSKRATPAPKPKAKPAPVAKAAAKSMAQIMDSRYAE